MSTEHTPGRLKIGIVDHKGQSVEIDAESRKAYMDFCPWQGLATCHGDEDDPLLGSALMQANARRLVACWNF